jgi:Ca2+-binding RTX toxin-like protein
MWGDAGTNTYYGQGGDDYFYARNSSADTLYGQAGIDHAQIDNGSDVYNTIEDLLA